MSDKAEKPTEHKLLIEFVYQKHRRLLKKTKYFVQNNPFEFGLRVKNIDDKSSPKGKVQKLSLRSGEGGTITYPVEEELFFRELNPGEEVTLWWPDPITVIIKGQTWVSCIVKPEEEKKKTTFVTFQYDLNSKKESRYEKTNSWGDGLVIRGELEQQQAKTNFLIFILTMLVFLNGVWGLDIIFKSIFSCLGDVFSAIGMIFTKLG